MKEKTLFMMVGLPGSGKSTWVDYHDWKERCYTYSTDYIIDSIASLHKVDYDFIFKQSTDLAKRICDHQLAITQTDDVPVIFWDQTNLTRKSRKGKLAQVDPAYRRVAVVVQCQDRNVWLERCKSRKGKHIPLKVLEDMEKSFEMPEESEGFKEIRIIKT